MPGLSSEQRKKIEAQLLRADGAFERSVDPDSGALVSMRQELRRYKWMLKSDFGGGTPPCLYYIYRR